MNNEQRDKLLNRMNYSFICGVDIKIDKSEVYGLYHDMMYNKECLVGTNVNCYNDGHYIECCVPYDISDDKIKLHLYQCDFNYNYGKQTIPIITHSLLEWNLGSRKSYIHYERYMIKPLSFFLDYVADKVKNAPYPLTNINK